MIKKCSYFIVTASAIALITMAFKGVETTLTTNNYSNVSKPLMYNVLNYDNALNKVDERLNDINFSIKTNNSFIDFKEALAVKESDGDYKSVNSYGYMGKYQFGKGTLKYIGLKNIKDFLRHFNHFIRESSP